MNLIRRAGLPRLPIILLIILISLIFFWFENYVIQKEELEIPSVRLPSGFDGFRVTVVADVQGKEFGEGSMRLISAVAESRPDIIAINGDLIDKASELAMVEPLVKGLLEIAPVFYVTGNHEWAAGNVYRLMELLEGLGVKVLKNSYVTLEQNGGWIVLAGVHDPNGPYDMKTPEELVAEIRLEAGEGAYILMLAHRNDAMDMWADLGVDVVLVGHGHGGIIRLPFVGGLIGTDRALFPKFSGGLYEKDRTAMLVSRGLGNSVVDFRLFNRPHLPTAILRSE